MMTRSRLNHGVLNRIKKIYRGGDQIYYGVSGFKSRVLQDVARKSRVLLTLTGFCKKKITKNGHRKIVGVPTLLLL